jgi:tRNA/rRNA methyltransferase
LIPTPARVRIVLCQPSHPGNIGATARAMLTMGFEALYLVNPRRFPDRDADAMATGAVEVLTRATVCGSLAEALAGTQLAIGLTARRRDLASDMVDVREAAAAAADASRSGSVAFVFGTEMSGLTNAELSHCQLLATIPTNPGFSSLNLAAAVQVVCYEARRAFADTPPPAAGERDFALAEEVEALFRHMEAGMIASGFLDPASPRRLMPRLRRLFGRTRLEKEEVNILRGMLRAFGAEPPDTPE